MYARVRELLTPEEWLQYLQIPPDPGEWELGTYFTFTQHDLEIIQQCQRDYNRLGFPNESDPGQSVDATNLPQPPEPRSESENAK